MKFHPIQQSALIILALFAAFSFEACDPIAVRASGDDLTMTFDDTDFEGIDICVPAEVTVHTDSVFKVEVTCEETAMPYVETEVKGGVLRIWFSRNVFDVDDMKITVSAPNWDHFELSGSGKINVLDAIEGQSLLLDISGSGDIKVDEAHFDKVSVEVSGSGNVDIAGDAADLDCRISGSGELEASDFPVATANVRISGSGNAYVNVSETLTGNISGSGSIYYTGDPQLDVHVSGSGKIRKQ